ncbi:hypothetical protein SG34_031590 [Thalassomonas viridans]|uniref:Uncharacterized protein n=1 Tax=Thalassomonas viridans TaxID=137584 RepID=A0AAE9ZBU8_9GAMM|nr:hypothetical protein [Thalassomonas viridans]WDE08468.1 hypothetical protein SG34_031590 [Thalassomonas viridans]
MLYNDDLHLDPNERRLVRYETINDIIPRFKIAILQKDEYKMRDFWRTHRQTLSLYAKLDLEDAARNIDEGLTATSAGAMQLKLLQYCKIVEELNLMVADQ